jgi:hypothetical protein
LDEASSKNDKLRLSKKRRAKIEKIRRDASLDPSQKETLISQIEQECI